MNEYHRITSIIGEDQHNQLLGTEYAFEASDTGNARLLARAFGSKLKYCCEWDTWFLWDGSRWERDAQARIVELAKHLPKLIVKLAERQPNSSECRNIYSWAARSASCEKIQATIKLAQSEPALVVSAKQLDSHDLLLPAPNGEINLADGVFQQADRLHLMTMRIGTTYEPEAECPRWIKFIEEITGGDSGLGTYLQKLAGYCLTGLTREQCFFTLWGTGANGKSLFVSVLQELMGDFAKIVDCNSLMVKRDGGGPTPELARLPGARLVLASEPNEDCRIDEATIKLVTGQDRLVCRKLYGQPFEFDPKFKLLLSTNHKPIVRGTDEAIWRRMRIIPFSQTFAPGRRDENLRMKLISELPGILNWALHGCRLYLTERLPAALQVAAATSSYRDEMDIVGQWIADQCVAARESKTALKILYEDYRAWCYAGGFHIVGKKRFGDELTRRGFSRGTSSGNVQVHFGLRRATAPGQL